MLKFESLEELILSCNYLESISSKNLPKTLQVCCFLLKKKIKTCISDTMCIRLLKTIFSIMSFNNCFNVSIFF